MYSPDFEELENLVQQRYLSKQVKGDLVLYNYTNPCIYDRHWNEHTVNSRGSVYEISTGKRIALAFPKFFNFGELEESKQEKILKEKNFEVYEKVDGSLGIMYFYNGSWEVNTRGSFNSDQAVYAKELLKNYDLSKVDKGYTILVEIIYPENRIIVDYGSKEELVLLAVYDVNSGQEISLEDVECDLPRSKKVKFNSIEDILQKLKELSSMEEGFVVRFSNGYRVKFKGEEYMTLARLVNNITENQFLKIMIKGKIELSYLESVPEEFRELADSIVLKSETEYNTVLNEIYESYASVENVLGKLTLENRKELGLYLKNNKVKHSGAMFSLLLHNSADDYIMKFLKEN